MDEQTNHVLVVDGQEVKVCVCGKHVCEITLEYPLVTVSLSDTCGFGIESEQGTAYANGKLMEAVQQFATSNGFEF
mgnify:CR=1 FL=1